MAKFNVLENKMLIVNGSLVSVANGELETEDKALISALSKAINVEAVKVKGKKAAEPEPEDERQDDNEPEPEPEKNQEPAAE